MHRSRFVKREPRFSGAKRVFWDHCNRNCNNSRPVSTLAAPVYIKQRLPGRIPAMEDDDKFRIERIYRQLSTSATQKSPRREAKGYL
jgi:hypothetical protein